MLPLPTAYHPLDFAGGGTAVLGPCFHGGEEMDSQTVVNGNPTPDRLRLRTSDRCCQFYSETVFDNEMQLLELPLL